MRVRIRNKVQRRERRVTRIDLDDLETGEKEEWPQHVEKADCGDEPAKICLRGETLQGEADGEMSYEHAGDYIPKPTLVSCSVSS